MSNLQEWQLRGKRVSNSASVVEALAIKPMHCEGELHALSPAAVKDTSMQQRAEHGQCPMHTWQS